MEVGGVVDTALTVVVVTVFDVAERIYVMKVWSSYSIYRCGF